MTNALHVAVLFLAGLAVGSFLAVCIHRLPHRQSVATPASRCPACRRTLRWIEMVPVLSFIWLGGRCRACRARIDVLDPGIELLTPAVFLLQFMAVGWHPLLAVRLLFAGALIVLLMTDYRHRLLPDAVTIPGIGIGLAAAVAFEPGWRSALGGVAVGGGLLLIREGYYRLRHREGLGLGDVKMLAMIGAFLGWQQALVTLLLASLAGSVIGAVIIGLRLGERDYPLPLGSFLAVAALIASVWGENLVRWYSSLF